MMKEIRTITPAHGRTKGDGVGIAFHYWPGRGTPIVCIHGLTASSMSFVGLADSLAGQHAVLILDLRGRGNSDKPRAPYGMAQHARDVAAVWQAFGAESYIVVRHSMGGGQTVVGGQHHAGEIRSGRRVGWRRRNS